MKCERRLRTRLHVQLLAAAALLWSPAALSAETQSETDREQCEKLAATDLAGGAAVAGAVLVPGTDKAPARCKVLGSITTSPRSVINFQVELPVSAHWNGDLLALGGGGFDGFIPSAVPQLMQIYDRNWFGPDAERSRFFVLVSNDSGHQGRGRAPNLDFSWAASNPDALTNYAHRANHLVLWATVGIAKEFYGREPKYRYMHGMSNGGRQGLMAAQIYPKDYHGIVAFSPAMGKQDIGASQAGLMQQIYSTPNNWLSVEQRQMVAKAEIAACDGLDGLTDGIIANYRACRFEFASMLCSKAPADAKDNCLTPDQVATLERVKTRAAPDAPASDSYYAGADAGEWNYMFGSSFAARDATNFLLEDNRVKIISEDPNASIMTHDPAAHEARYRAFAEEIDATDPDLSAFYANGGKLLVFFGVSDLCVSFQRAARYFAEVETRMGRPKTRKFLRFLPLPSQGHSWSGTGPNNVAALSALQSWVEKDVAPDRLVGAHVDTEGKTRFTRPLCEVGSYARYRRGNPDEAASFRCVAD